MFGLIFYESDINWLLENMKLNPNMDTHESFYEGVCKNKQTNKKPFYQIETFLRMFQILPLFDALLKHSFILIVIVE